MAWLSVTAMEKSDRRRVYLHIQVVLMVQRPGWRTPDDRAISEFCRADVKAYAGGAKSVATRAYGKSDRRAIRRRRC